MRRNQLVSRLLQSREGLVRQYVGGVYAGPEGLRGGSETGKRDSGPGGPAALSGRALQKRPQPPVDRPADGDATQLLPLLGFGRQNRLRSDRAPGGAQAMA